MPQVTLLNCCGLVISSYATIPNPEKDIANNKFAQTAII
jgi:hypothetical protein